MINIAAKTLVYISESIYKRPHLAGTGRRTEKNGFIGIENDKERFTLDTAETWDGEGFACPRRYREEFVAGDWVRFGSGYDYFFVSLLR